MCVCLRMRECVNEESGRRGEAMEDETLLTSLGVLQQLLASDHHKTAAWARECMCVCERTEKNQARSNQWQKQLLKVRSVCGIINCHPRIPAKTAPTLIYQTTYLLTYLLTYLFIYLLTY